jgi:hypothetical protein
VRVGSLMRKDEWLAQGLQAQEAPQQPYTESLFDESAPR